MHTQTYIYISLHNDIQTINLWICRCSTWLNIQTCSWADPHTHTHRFWPGSLEMWRRKWSKKSKRDFMKIRTPPLSGNQRQASSSVKQCRPAVTKGKKEREREEGRGWETHLSVWQFPPTLPLEEAVHFVVPFINVSLSFPPLSLFLPLPLFPSTLKVQVTRRKKKKPLEQMKIWS